MEYSPPPLFKQGASARAKVIVFALIAMVLLVVDARFRALTSVRQAVGVVLYPLQVVALMPRDAAYAAGGYFVSLSSLQKENQAMKRQQVANAQLLQQGQQLLAENAQLRRLLGASERLTVKSMMSEILYDTRDSFTRKIVLNRGSRHGIAPGLPVIDDIGVVGQVTRVFPFTSEVTLLTDKDQAIPVQVLRSGLRSVAYGKGQSGVLDLRFMAANADIRKGDTLVTSGIDGIYPPGLAVATVSQVEHKSSDAFARIVLQPTAGVDRNRQLLILLAEEKFPPRPEPEEVRDGKKDKKKKSAAKDGAKEGDKTGKPEAGKADPALEAKTDKAASPATAKVLPAAAVKPATQDQANANPKQAKPAPSAAAPKETAPVRTGAGAAVPDQKAAAKPGLPAAQQTPTNAPKAAADGTSNGAGNRQAATPVRTGATVPKKENAQ